MSDEGCDREMTVEELCQRTRVDIEDVKKEICFIMGNSMFRRPDNNLAGANIPVSRNVNIKANLTLAFRHLEDARMRLGKAMQAYQGGISILDKHQANPDGTVK